MLSNKIYKHFFAELCKYFLLVLFTFSIIVWTVQAVNFLDLIVDDGHAVAVYLSYSLLNITKMMGNTFLDKSDFFLPKVDHENCVNSSINRNQ